MKRWLKNKTWKGLQVWGNIKNPPPCKDGLKMRYVCDECAKSKEFKWPDLPGKFKQFDNGAIFCNKCWKERPLERSLTYNNPFKLGE